MPRPDADTFAAVDLGSNSFHLIVARYTGGRLQIIDRIKEMVRLAGGLDDQRRLSEAAMARALECLLRFRERLKEIPPANIRAVGTNTLRQAKNSAEFMSRARRALGARIEVIAGREEARLIYLGIAHFDYREDEQRLVVDIGGGSTEVIIGRGFEPLLTESLYMGCVNMTRRFFADGKISPKRMRKAILYARQELETIENSYRALGWNSAIGSSGTILTAQRILELQGLSGKEITAAGLEKLCAQLIDAGHADRLELPGLSGERAPVFAGGVAILCGVFEALQIERMAVSEGALREGLLYDSIGRRQRADMRERTVADLMRRYGIDGAQAARVEATALACFVQAREAWGLTDESDGLLLAWATRLHEIGLAIAHSQHQRHGAYLVNYSDLPGFSRQDQQLLATLIRCHRRKLPLEELQQLPEDIRDRSLRLAVLLRLSVVLHRSRSAAPLPPLQLGTGDRSLEIRFPEAWLAKHPLTAADLATEAGYLEAAGFTLTFG
jgi:exopolyphosphatase/guanosine-5'-triphosphate,3'-diphosphate pyrophosphatase